MKQVDSKMENTVYKLIKLPDPKRMSSDTFNSYFDSHEDWYLHTPQQTDLHKFIIENAEELGFALAESMIRVGAGDGVLDSLIIRSCMPCLKVYYGIENVGELFVFLPDTVIRECYNVDSSFFKASIEKFKGPDNLVDLVLIMPFYFFWSLSFEEDIRRAYSWLRPGGNLIVGLIREGPFFDKLDLKFSIPKWKMNDAYVQQTIENIGLESKVFTLDHQFHTQALGSLFAHLCLFKNCNADEIEAVLKLVNEMKNSDGFLLVQSIIRVIHRD